MTRDNLTLLYVNNKSADQPVHSRHCAESDQHLCYFISEMYISQCCKIFSILASLCSGADWFEPSIVENAEDRFLASRSNYTTANFKNTYASFHLFLLYNIYRVQTCSHIYTEMFL